MREFYRLEGKTPVPADIGSFKIEHIEQTEKDNTKVSTVFLGIDHSFGYGGPPVLFETMIFGGEQDGYQERCCTYDEAIAMHAKACQIAFGMIDARKE